MQRIKEPDSVADQKFIELVDRYQTSLLRMCYLNLRDLSLAEDAVQETFIKAYRSMSSFHGESSIKTWLMSIAINTCRDMQRGSWLKHMDRRVTLDQLQEKSGVFPENMILINIEIARLPVKQKEVVLLYYYQDMRIEEIAQVLGVAVSTVAERLKRAKDKLRQVLKGEFFNE